MNSRIDVGIETLFFQKHKAVITLPTVTIDRVSLA